MYKGLARLVRNSNRIFMYTGSGISAPSSIPTFNAPNGLWERTYINGVDPTWFLKKRVVDARPTTVWKWLGQYRGLAAAAKPNAAHYAALRLQEYSKEAGKEFSLATETLDGLHAELAARSKVLAPKVVEQEGVHKFGLIDEVIELHGNVRYMRCNKECHPHLYRVPDQLVDDHVPICPRCSQPMRPHMLLLDEYYSEGNYRASLAIKKGLQSDCMIIVGSSLKTPLPNTILYESADEGKLVIEINPKRHVNSQRKNVHHITEPCEISLPKLVNEVLSMRIQILTTELSFSVSVNSGTQ